MKINEGVSSSIVTHVLWLIVFEKAYLQKYFDLGKQLKYDSRALEVISDDAIYLIRDRV